MTKNKALSGDSSNNHLDFLFQIKTRDLFWLSCPSGILVANVSGGD
jgi:hypothetical protein